ncbi:hypothetical protein K438DRAFT_1957732 [Mycena galopus ATCC 62051]|nr:hypothetical protein K438DRAFT_1957732 [Mycena galopus ATCC 62051]
MSLLLPLTILRSISSQPFLLLRPSSTSSSSKNPTLRANTSHLLRTTHDVSFAADSGGLICSKETVSDLKTLDLGLSSSRPQALKTSSRPQEARVVDLARYEAVVRISDVGGLEARHKFLALRRFAKISSFFAVGFPASSSLSLIAYSLVAPTHEHGTNPAIIIISWRAPSLTNNPARQGGGIPHSATYMLLGRANVKQITNNSPPNIRLHFIHTNTFIPTQATKFTINEIFYPPSTLNLSLLALSNHLFNEADATPANITS